MTLPETTPSRRTWKAKVSIAEKKHQHFLDTLKAHQGLILDCFKMRSKSRQYHYLISLPRLAHWAFCKDWGYALQHHYLASNPIRSVNPNHAWLSSQFDLQHEYHRTCGRRRVYRIAYDRAYIADVVGKEWTYLTQDPEIVRRVLDGELDLIGGKVYEI